jgi:hypothetical protein
MRLIAAERGKSNGQGQFYAPSEVSRIIAKDIGISPKNSKAGMIAFDPTCGLGSLLFNVAAESPKRITLKEQEKDVTTASLARMNMIVHDSSTAKIVAGNTLASPKCLDRERLRTCHYVVANPAPFRAGPGRIDLMPPSIRKHVSLGGRHRANSEITPICFTSASPRRARQREQLSARRWSRRPIFEKSVERRDFSVHVLKRAGNCSPL